MFKFYYIVAKVALKTSCFRLCYFSADWDEKSQNVLQMPVVFLTHLCMTSSFSSDLTHLKNPTLLSMIGEKGHHIFWGILKITETST